MTNRPVNFNDPTGHRSCDDEYGKCTDKLWRLSPEQKFTHAAKSPLHKDEGPINYSGFGGCNTIKASCSFGHHAAIDSLNNWDAEKDEDKRVNWVGRPIYAVEEGTVVRVGKSDWGNYVMVEHVIDGEEFYSIYAHLDSYSVKKGMKVDNDMQIGNMGGTTSGGDVDPHLHFEVRKSVNVDVAATDPFNGKVWWPESMAELSNNFVDLAATSFVDYEDTFTKWP